MSRPRASTVSTATRQGLFFCTGARAVTDPQRGRCDMHRVTLCREHPPAAINCYVLWQLPGNR